jgi:pimeloyl-ACP methyl ester carboxylesterase
MAQDMVTIMERLGFPRFSVAGHDRGGRVAYRMALDHPNRVDRLAVLDILPTETVWDRADARFALAFWPWSLLAQPRPLPALWRAWCDHVQGHRLSAGHFFPEEAPEQTAEALNRFFGSGRRVCSLG